MPIALTKSTIPHWRACTPHPPNLWACSAASTDIRLPVRLLKIRLRFARSTHYDPGYDYPHIVLEAAQARCSSPCFFRQWSTSGHADDVSAPSRQVLGKHGDGMYEHLKAGGPPHAAACTMFPVYSIPLSSVEDFFLGIILNTLSATIHKSGGASRRTLVGCGAPGGRVSVALPPLRDIGPCSPTRWMLECNASAVFAIGRDVAAADSKGFHADTIVITFEHIQLTYGTASAPGVYTSDIAYFTDLATVYRAELQALYDVANLSFFVDAFLDGCCADGIDPDELFDVYVWAHKEMLCDRPVVAYAVTIPSYIRNGPSHLCATLAPGPTVIVVAADRHPTEI
ncbi:hypothetical protein C8R45DRAFT_1102949 [Mycena sanguinolenta]|nr:hypothetical protein C8R45DRAFT_1102949 [Mycena sanguinolenta]